MAVFVSAIIAVGEAVGVAATISAVATAVAETGIALNIVGHLTDNQELEKVGGIMSMAGGIAGLATSAFTAVSAATAATDSGTSLAVDSADTSGAMGSVTPADVPTPDVTPTPGDPVPSSAITNGSYDPLGTGADTALDNMPNVGGAGTGSGMPLDGAGTGATGAVGATDNASLASGGAGEINATGSTVAPSASSGGTSTGLNPTGSSLTNGNYDPLNTGANNPLADASNAPNAPPGSQSTQFQGGPTTSNAAATMNSSGGNSAFQLNNEAPSTMTGQDPALTAPGTQIAGQNTQVNPGGSFDTPSTPRTVPDYNDANSTYTSPSGNTITVGQNAEQVTDAANDSKPGLLDGLTNWVKNNQTLSGQLASGAMQAASNVYATRKNAATAANQLALQQQIQNNKSAQVAQQAPSGIISGARKKGNP
jgi:hypothetical protein